MLQFEIDVNVINKNKNIGKVKKRPFDTVISVFNGREKGVGVTIYYIILRSAYSFFLIPRGEAVVSFQF